MKTAYSIMKASVCRNRKIFFVYLFCFLNSLYRAPSC